MNLLPYMCAVSRNCGFTQQLESIINDKFDENEKRVFMRWLEIVKDEIQIKENKKRF